MDRSESVLIMMASVLIMMASVMIMTVSVMIMTASVNYFIIYFTFVEREGCISKLMVFLP